MRRSTLMAVVMVQILGPLERCSPGVLFVWHDLQGVGSSCKIAGQKCACSSGSTPFVGTAPLDGLAVRGRLPQVDGTS